MQDWVKGVSYEDEISRTFYNLLSILFKYCVLPIALTQVLQFVHAFVNNRTVARKPYGGVLAGSKTLHTITSKFLR